MPTSNISQQPLESRLFQQFKLKRAHLRIPYDKNRVAACLTYALYGKQFLVKCDSFCKTLCEPEETAPSHSILLQRAANRFQIKIHVVAAASEMDEINVAYNRDKNKEYTIFLCKENEYDAVDLVEHHNSGQATSNFSSLYKHVHDILSSHKSDDDSERNVLIQSYLNSIQALKELFDKNCAPMRIALVGSMGSGKSKLCNAILGCNILQSIDAGFSCTQTCIEIHFHEMETFKAKIGLFSLEEIQAILLDGLPSMDISLKTASETLLHAIYGAAKDDILQELELDESVHWPKYQVSQEAALLFQSKEKIVINADSNHFATELQAYTVQILQHAFLLTCLSN